jgi:hypothetical protein
MQPRQEMRTSLRHLHQIRHLYLSLPIPPRSRLHRFRRTVTYDRGVNSHKTMYNNNIYVRLRSSQVLCTGTTVPAVFVALLRCGLVRFSLR